MNSSSLVDAYFCKQWQLGYGWTVAVSGSIPELGSWRHTAAIPLIWHPGHEWKRVVSLPADSIAEFKYVAISSTAEVEWEAGSNRRWNGKSLQTSIGSERMPSGSGEVSSILNSSSYSSSTFQEAHLNSFAEKLANSISEPASHAIQDHCASSSSAFTSEIQSQNGYSDSVQAASSASMYPAKIGFLPVSVVRHLAAQKSPQTVPAPDKDADGDENMTYVPSLSTPSSSPSSSASPVQNPNHELKTMQHQQHAEPGLENKHQADDINPPSNNPSPLSSSFPPGSLSEAQEHVAGGSSPSSLPSSFLPAAPVGSHPPSSSDAASVVLSPVLDQFAQWQANSNFLLVPPPLACTLEFNKALDEVHRILIARGLRLNDAELIKKIAEGKPIEPLDARKRSPLSFDEFMALRADTVLQASAPNLAALLAAEASQGLVTLYCEPENKYLCAPGLCGCCSLHALNLCALCADLQTYLQQAGVLNSIGYKFSLAETGNCVTVYKRLPLTVQTKAVFVGAVHVLEDTYYAAQAQIVGLLRSSTIAASAGPSSSSLSSKKKGHRPPPVSEVPVGYVMSNSQEGTKMIRVVFQVSKAHDVEASILSDSSPPASPFAPSSIAPAVRAAAPVLVAPASTPSLPPYQHPLAVSVAAASSSSSSSHVPAGPQSQATPVVPVPYAASRLPDASSSYSSYSAAYSPSALLQQQQQQYHHHHLPQQQQPMPPIARKFVCFFEDVSSVQPPPFILPLAQVTAPSTTLVSNLLNQVLPAFTRALKLHPDSLKAQQCLLYEKVRPEVAAAGSLSMVTVPKLFEPRDRIIDFTREYVVARVPQDEFDQWNPRQGDSMVYTCFSFSTLPSTIMSLMSPGRFILLKSDETSVEFRSRIAHHFGFAPSLLSRIVFTAAVPTNATKAHLPSSSTPGFVSDSQFPIFAQESAPLLTWLLDQKFSLEQQSESSSISNSSTLALYAVPIPFNHLTTTIERTIVYEEDKRYNSYPPISSITVSSISSPPSSSSSFSFSSSPSSSSASSPSKTGILKEASSSSLSSYHSFTKQKKKRVSGIEEGKPVHKEEVPMAHFEEWKLKPSWKASIMCSNTAVDYIRQVYPSLAANLLLVKTETIPECHGEKKNLDDLVTLIRGASSSIADVQECIEDSALAQKFTESLRTEAAQSALSKFLAHQRPASYDSSVSFRLQWFPDEQKLCIVGNPDDVEAVRFFVLHSIIQVPRSMNISNPRSAKSSSKFLPVVKIASPSEVVRKVEQIIQKVEHIVINPTPPVLKPLLVDLAKRKPLEVEFMSSNVQLLQRLMTTASTLNVDACFVRSLCLPSGVSSSNSSSGNANLFVDSSQSPLANALQVSSRDASAPSAAEDLKSAAQQLEVILDEIRYLEVEVSNIPSKTEYPALFLRVLNAAHSSKLLSSHSDIPLNVLVRIASSSKPIIDHVAFRIAGFSLPCAKAAESCRDTLERYEEASSSFTLTEVSHIRAAMDSRALNLKNLAHRTFVEFEWKPAAEFSSIASSSSSSSSVGLLGDDKDRSSNASVIKEAQQGDYLIHVAGLDHNTVQTVLEDIRSCIPASVAAAQASGKITQEIFCPSDKQRFLKDLLNRLNFSAKYTVQLRFDDKRQQVVLMASATRLDAAENGFVSAIKLVEAFVQNIEVTKIILEGQIPQSLVNGLYKKLEEVMESLKANAKQQDSLSVSIQPVRPLNPYASIMVSGLKADASFLKACGLVRGLKVITSTFDLGLTEEEISFGWVNKSYAGDLARKHEVECQYVLNSIGNAPAAVVSSSARSVSFAAWTYSYAGASSSSSSSGPKSSAKLIISSFDVGKIKACETEVKEFISSRRGMKEKRQKDLDRFDKEHKESKSCDVAIVMDITGSMGSWLGKAKTQSQQIIDECRRKFVGYKIKIAFVGYRDLCDALEKRYTVVNFTENGREVENALKACEAYGGGDAAEDVFGGLEKALALNWSSKARCLFLVADACCHGRRYHPPSYTDSDAYDNHRSFDSDGSELARIMKNVTEKDLQFTFVRITDQTDKMIELFKQEYKKQQELQDYDDSSIKELVVFDLGSQSDGFVKSVVSSVATSLSTSAMAGRKKLKLVKEKLQDIVWSASDSGWDREFYGTIVTFNRPATLQQALDPNSFRLDMYANRKSGVRLRMRKMPFASGAERLAYGLLDISSGAKLVGKKYIVSTRVSKDDFFQEMSAQARTRYFSWAFDKDLLTACKADTPRLIDFVVCSVCEFVDPDTGKLTYIAVEPFLGSEFLKLNNNYGVVYHEAHLESSSGGVSSSSSSPNSALSEVCQCFSHWTFNHSDGNILVCDVQGASHCLTDPAVHTRDPTLINSGTNFGVKGQMKFFETHSCNDLCKKLSLEKPPLPPVAPGDDAIVYPADRAGEIKGTGKISLGCMGLCGNPVELPITPFTSPEAILDQLNRLMCEPCKARYYHPPKPIAASSNLSSDFHSHLHSHNPGSSSARSEDSGFFSKFGATVSAIGHAVFGSDAQEKKSKPKQNHSARPAWKN